MSGRSGKMVRDSDRNPRGGGLGIIRSIMESKVAWVECQDYPDKFDCSSSVSRSTKFDRFKSSFYRWVTPLINESRRTYVYSNLEMLPRVFTISKSRRQSFLLCPLKILDYIVI